MLGRPCLTTVLGRGLTQTRYPNIQGTQCRPTGLCLVADTAGTIVACASRRSPLTDSLNRLSLRPITAPIRTLRFGSEHQRFRSVDVSLDPLNWAEFNTGSCVTDKNRQLGLVIAFHSLEPRVGPSTGAHQRLTKMTTIRNLDFASHPLDGDRVGEHLVRPDFGGGCSGSGDRHCGPGRAARLFQF